MVEIISGLTGDAENARHELAGHENARNAIVLNTECCICLSIAELLKVFTRLCDDV